MMRARLPTGEEGVDTPRTLLACRVTFRRYQGDPVWKLPSNWAYEDDKDDQSGKTFTSGPWNNGSAIWRVVNIAVKHSTLEAFWRANKSGWSTSGE